jgi:hypothetical protein
MFSPSEGKISGSSRYTCARRTWRGCWPAGQTGSPSRRSSAATLYFLGHDLAEALRLLGCEVVGPLAELFDASRMPMMLP